jgi:nicotinate-nucleotide pyrophosphorylase (carboxylating)
MNNDLTNLDEFIAYSLQEDIGDGDHTSLACIPSDAKGVAKLVIKQNGVIAGVELAEKIFHKVDSTLKFTQFIADGTEVKVGDVVFRVEGKSQSILTAERLALNFMQRMSGIATKTRHLAKKIEGTKAKILDTRKTTPGLRSLEKLAVKLGGGVNHRFGLYDMIMIKDNHIDFAGGIRQAIEKTHEYLKANNKELKIEIEARDLIELDKILEVGRVHRIMLDNFSFEDMRTAVVRIAGKYETEASGGINEDTIAEYAACGVDYISVGALTHSYSSLDMSLMAE